MSWADVTWERVTSIQTLLDGGTFIMGYEATAKSGVIIPLRSVDCGATTSANGIFNSGTTSTNGTIDMSTVTTTSDYEIYISASSTTGYINIQRTNNTGDYYGATSGGSSKNLARLYTSGNSNETNILPEWASEANNQFKLSANVSGSYKYLKYNTGSPRYCFYNSAGEKIVFYKKVESAPTKVATPVISGDAKFVRSTTVTITCATDGAAIQYTTDNGTSWNDYDDPFSITETTTVKAKATDPEDELDDSEESDAMTFTKVTPMTVAAAKTYIDADVDLDDQFVSGIVSQVDGISSNAITYWISDDGTTTGQMEVYKGKGLNGADFSDVTDLEVGDRVIVYGNLTYYEKESVYEFSSGSQIKSLVEIQDNDLAKTNDISLSMASPSTTADATDYFTTSSSGTITYESGNTSVATVSAAGVVTPVAAGSTTITVTQAKTATYKAGEITINVTVSAASLNETEIVVDPTSGSTVYGTLKVVDYLIDDTYDGTVAAVSSNTAVATVAITQHTDGEGTFTITPVAVGTAVITISAPATATCKAADNVTYTITVKAPAGGTIAAPAPTTIFVERFSTAAGTGPSGASWSGSMASDDFASDNDGWSATNNSYAGNGCARFGTSQLTGNATTPAISFDPSVTYTLKFKAGAWNGDGTTLTLSCDDKDAVLGQTSFTMLNNAWTEYETTVKAASGSKLTFTTSKKRFFLDDVVVTSGTPIKATLNASGYATFCSEYPLDFSGASDYSAWQITGISSSNVITFAKVTGSVKGGTGLLLKGEGGATITLTSADSDNELGDNLLEGTLAPTYVAANKYYGLSGANFVKINAGTVKAGKAILDADYVTVADVKAFTFVFEDDATGIRTVETVSAEEAAQIFNLAGQRINKMQKGINIVNGKKVLK